MLNLGDSPETTAVEFIARFYLAFVNTLVDINKFSLALTLELVAHEEHRSKVRYANLLAHLA